ncbi:proton-coupled folate transporter-like isoform X4 [Lytechinus pictus]|uniref:proton-coupled folate transporter-like isoform X4 n=1 Tax=Lytechinus pictus TaxID=7653 RepID=UPI0030B9CE57
MNEMDAAEDISKARCIATEPINFLLLAIQGMLVTLRTLYIQETLASDYGYNLLPQQRGNCSLQNVTDPLEVQINSETALWIMWLSSISTFLPILTASVLVASSDFIGRKPILILSAIGHLIASLIYLLVSLIDLPLSVTLLAAITLGISGDTSAAITVSTAYIADSTSGKSRTQRLVLQSLATYVGWGSGQAFAGILVRYLDNFSVCFAIPVALSVINLFYTICPGILLETISHREYFNFKKVLHKSFKNLRGVFGMKASKGRRNVWCLMTIICFIMFVVESVYDVIVIYGLGRPFCWTPDVVGYYYAAVSLFPAVATAVSLFRTTASPVCKGLISKTVRKKEHGMYFALLSLFLSLSSVCSPFVINGLFAYTIKTGFPQITLYVTAVILLIPIFLNGLLQYNDRRIRSGEKSSNVDDHEDDDDQKARSPNQNLNFVSSGDEKEIKGAMKDEN